MGEWKQNVPTRFEPETLVELDRERAWHEMTRSQYIRVAMKKWFRMVAEGTVQLLDVPMQQEQRNQREQCEQSLQIGSLAPSFPALEGRAKKPPVRIGVEVRSRRGQEISGVNRRCFLDGSAGLVAYNLLSLSKLRSIKCIRSAA